MSTMFQINATIIMVIILFAIIFYALLMISISYENEKSNKSSENTDKLQNSNNTKTSDTMTCIIIIREGEIQDDEN